MQSPYGPRFNNSTNQPQNMMNLIRSPSASQQTSLRQQLQQQQQQLNNDVCIYLKTFIQQKNKFILTIKKSQLNRQQLIANMVQNRKLTV